MLLQCSQPGPASFRARKGEDGDAGAQPCCHQGGTPTWPRQYLAVLEEPDDVLEAVVAEKDGLEDRPVLAAEHGWDGIYNEVEIAQHPSRTPIPIPVPNHLPSMSTRRAMRPPAASGAKEATGRSELSTLK